MKVYSIFDDFDEKATEIINLAGEELIVHPTGMPRPDNAQMKRILEDYDCVIIGTSQKITEDMFENITSPRIIATASVGLDHIKVPDDKKKLITIINTPKANAQSVAEYTIGCALACCKRLLEGNNLYREGKNNKKLYQKPEDLAGRTMGVIGAGNISVQIMKYAQLLGMNVICWTRSPNQHRELEEQGIHFTNLDELIKTADVISVNLPNNSGTKGLISARLIMMMKETAIFISISRLDTVDVNSLFEKAKKHPGFYVCLDLDVNEYVINRIPNVPNVMVTPHIAGGTVETRKRMFRDVAKAIALLHDSY